MSHDTTVESRSMHLEKGRESGPGTGRLINKRGKLELILLVTASAGTFFFPSGTYPKFLASTLIFPPRPTAKKRT